MGLIGMLFGGKWERWYEKNKGGRRYVQLGLPDDIDTSDESLQKAIWRYVAEGDDSAAADVTRIMRKRKQ